MAITSRSVLFATPRRWPSRGLFWRCAPLALLVLGVGAVPRVSAAIDLQGELMVTRVDKGVSIDEALRVRLVDTRDREWVLLGPHRHRAAAIGGQFHVAHVWPLSSTPAWQRATTDERWQMLYRTLAKHVVVRGIEGPLVTTKARRLPSLVVTDWALVATQWQGEHRHAMAGNYGDWGDRRIWGRLGYGWISPEDMAWRERHYLTSPYRPGQLYWAEGALMDSGSAARLYSPSRFYRNLPPERVHDDLERCRPASTSRSCWYTVGPCRPQVRLDRDPICNKSRKRPAIYAQVAPGMGAVRSWGWTLGGHLDPLAGRPTARPVGRDLVSCYAEFPSESSICRMRDVDLLVTGAVADTHQHQGTTYELKSPLRRALRDEEAGIYLHPKVHFTLNWVDERACREIPFLKGPFKVFAGSSQLGEVFPGRREYSFPLREANGSRLWKWRDGSMWAPTYGVSWHADIRIAPTVPPVSSAPGLEAGYVETMPAQCGLAIENAGVRLDAGEVHAALSGLGVRAMQLKALVDKQRMLHARLLEGTRGVLCVLSRTAEAARQTVFDLTWMFVTTEQLGEYSLQAEAAVRQAVVAAQEVGALPPGDDVWSYYLANEPSLASLCLQSIDNAEPNEAAFDLYTGPVANEGVANARDFVEDQKQLKHVMALAWALAQAAQINEPWKEHEWMSIAQ